VCVLCCVVLGVHVRVGGGGHFRMFTNPLGENRHVVINCVNFI